MVEETRKPHRVVEDRRQPEVELVKTLPPQERGEGDDWFTLFEASRQEPVKMPTGTHYPHHPELGCASHYPIYFL